MLSKDKKKLPSSLLTWSSSAYSLEQYTAFYSTVKLPPIRDLSSADQFWFEQSPICEFVSCVSVLEFVTQVVHSLIPSFSYIHSDKLVVPFVRVRDSTLIVHPGAVKSLTWFEAPLMKLPHEEKRQEIGTFRLMNVNSTSEVTWQVTWRVEIGTDPSVQSIISLVLSNRASVS